MTWFRLKVDLQISDESKFKVKVKSNIFTNFHSIWNKSRHQAANIEQNQPPITFVNTKSSS